MSDTQHLRIFEPHPGIFAYYDGRVTGQRFMVDDNWVDRGAIGLGIATYALVAGASALIYDTHVSLAHGQVIRAHLEALGVRNFTVVYSHWHLDHVAGTAAFDGAPVIGNVRTLAHLEANRAGIEAGSYHGPPAINPLVLPDQTFAGSREFMFGGMEVQLIALNIHSDDATVLWLPERRILLAGDTVEDPLTYVGEPADFACHLKGLDRLAALEPDFVLPDHGAEAALRAGGFSADIIRATQSYIRWLMALRHAPEIASMTAQDVLAEALGQGVIQWFAPYEAVHVQNVAAALTEFGHG